MTSIAVVVIIATALAAALILGLAWIVSWRVIRPGRHTYWDEYTFLPSDMGVPYEGIHFTAPDGLALAGWFMPAAGSTIAVVLASGYRDRKASLLPVATGLWKQGFTVLLFDFRNQGDSAMDSVQTMGWREVGDMLAAVDVARQRCPGAAIACMGWSMGGVVSFFAAARDQRIAAVIADCAYADQRSIIAHNLRLATRLPPFPVVPLAEMIIRRRAGYWPGQVRPVDVVGAIAPRPLFLIHGQHDDLCLVEHAHRLFAAAGQPKELWIQPTARHVGAYFADPEHYISRVSSFLRSHLSERS